MKKINLCQHVFRNQHHKFKTSVNPTVLATVVNQITSVNPTVLATMGAMSDAEMVVSFVKESFREAMDAEDLLIDHATLTDFLEDVADNVVAG